MMPLPWHYRKKEHGEGIALAAVAKKGLMDIGGRGYRGPYGTGSLLLPLGLGGGYWAGYLNHQRRC